MRWPRNLWRINRVQDRLQRIAVKPAAGMHRDRSGFVHDDQRFVFVDDLNVCIHIRLARGGEQMQIALAGVHHMVRVNRPFIAREHVARGNDRRPFFARHVLQDVA
jgi:hypothetical protein